jgi:sugar phosphate isomerase/epimerase
MEWLNLERYWRHKKNVLHLVGALGLGCGHGHGGCGGRQPGRREAARPGMVAAGAKASDYGAELKKLQLQFRPFSH